MSWIHFLWTTAYVIGIGTFYLLVLFIIPLGFRDLVRMFRSLNEGGSSEEPEG